MTDDAILLFFILCYMISLSLFFGIVFTIIVSIVIYCLYILNIRIYNDLG